MKAFITGITGQDGSYLAEHLIELGYEVHGFVRRVAAEDQSERLKRIQGLNVKLHTGTIQNYVSLQQALALDEFDEIYHLAAQSDVASSFEDGFSTMEINVGGTHNILEAIRSTHDFSNVRFYFAASSEMFGSSPAPQNEDTPFRPRSTYGISKVAGYHLTRLYREAYGLRASCGILFNHESPRRGREFVTRKITSYVAAMKSGRTMGPLVLGNLEAKRDWGHARDYVRAMRLMLQGDPIDCVVATGITRTVRDFCETAFDLCGFDYRHHVHQSESLYRPAEVDVLQGDASRAERLLNWQPETKFGGMVDEMISADL